MSLLTNGGKILGIGSDCNVDDKGHTHSTIFESGNKHGSVRGLGPVVAFQGMPVHRLTSLDSW